MKKAFSRPGKIMEFEKKAKIMENWLVPDVGRANWTGLKLWRIDHGKNMKGSWKIMEFDSRKPLGTLKMYIQSEAC